jgi:hypothetical protein
LPKRRKRTPPLTGLGWKVESGYLRISEAIVDDFMIKKLISKSSNFDLRAKESLDNTEEHGKILVADFVERMIEADVKFDAFGFNVPSGLYDKIDDRRELKTALDKWPVFDKEIFVWSMGFPADNIDNLKFDYPRAGGYSKNGK